jgi:sec-independent protein translocase protein TatC
MLLHRAGIVTRQQLAGARRYIIVGVVALAAIVTPPDPGSQLILALPLLVLFEGSLLLMRIQERTMRRKNDAEKADDAAASAPVEDSQLSAD